MKGRSAKSKNPFLIVPLERQLNFPNESLRGELDRVRPGGDGIDDLGCQERQRKDASDVALVDPLKRR